jgi:hypothetical protein
MSRNTFTAIPHDYGKSQCPNSYNIFPMYNFSDLELELPCLLVDRHTIIFCIQAASSILLTSHNHVMSCHLMPATQSFGQSPQPADVTDCRTRTRERRCLSPRRCNPAVSSPRCWRRGHCTPAPARTHIPNPSRPTSPHAEMTATNAT